MTWNLVNVDSEPNDLEKVTVISASPLVLIKGRADPGTATSAAHWKVWRETYDANGIRLKVEFMNTSRRKDQIYDNIQAATTTWS